MPRPSLCCCASAAAATPKPERWCRAQGKAAAAGVGRKGGCRTPKEPPQRLHGGPYGAICTFLSRAAPGCARLRGCGCRGCPCSLCRRSSRFCAKPWLAVVVCADAAGAELLPLLLGVGTGPLHTMRARRSKASTPLHGTAIGHAQAWGLVRGFHQPTGCGGCSRLVFGAYGKPKGCA